MDALGRIINVVPLASGVHISLAQAGTAVTFCGYEDGGATDILVKSSESGAGSSEAALAVSRWHTSNGVGVDQVWTTHDLDTPLSTLEPTDDTSQDGWCFTVDQDDLPDGHTCVEVTPDGGTCVAIVHELRRKGAPSLLPAPGA